MIYYGMDIRYIAGLFDGEGYVGVQRQRTHGAYSLNVSITNTHTSIFEHLAAQYPGSVTMRKGGWGGRNCFVWKLHGAAAMRFLRDVEPHVYIKRDQVRLAMTFPLGAQGKRTTPELQAQRADIRLKLMEMKRVEFTREPIEVQRRLESDAVVTKAMGLYRSGMSAREVASELDVKTATVSYWLRQLGAGRARGEAISLAHERRLASFYEKPEILRAKKLYKSGLSALEVARRLRRKPATVNYWLRKLGLTRSLSDAAKLRCEKTTKEA